MYICSRIDFKWLKRQRKLNKKGKMETEENKNRDVRKVTSLSNPVWTIWLTLVTC